MKSVLLPLLLLLSSLLPLPAQLQVTLTLERTTFVAHEPITAAVTVKNLAGKDLALGGPAGLSWLQFNIQRVEDGHIITATEGEPKIEPTMIKEGATLRHKFTLSQSYPLVSGSSYLLSCSAYFPDLEKWIGSNKGLARVVSPKAPFYERTVGTGTAYHHYRLFTNKTTTPGPSGSNNEVQLLYVSITDEATDLNVVTYPLGPILDYRAPQPSTDRTGHLCVLYMATPQHYQYVKLDPKGNVVEQQMYKTSGGPPELMATREGSVRVSGGVPYDAQADAQSQADPKTRIRGLDERPQ